MFCPKCGTKVKAGTVTCHECGSKIVKKTSTKHPDHQHTMVWYKLLICFTLFANALINLTNGIVLLSCAKYKTEMDIAYDVVSKMKVLDIIFGIVMIAVAVLSVYTRFQLSSYKARGPKLLLVVYALGGIINFAYTFALSFIVAGTGPVSYSDEIISLIVALIMCIINYVYFKNRADLFIN